MLTSSSNVPNRERREITRDELSLLRRLQKVYRAAAVLTAGSESLGNRMFREGGTGDLLFLRQAVEEAGPWVNKEVS